MKTCSRCREPKPLAQFNRWAAAKDGLDSYCKACRSVIAKVSHSKHSEKVKAQQRESYRSGAKRRMIERNRDWLVEALTGACCAACHIDDPLVLEMDHVRGEKYRNVSFLVHNGYPLDTVKAEAAKCQILCANCHRRKTAAQFGWMRKPLKEAA